MSILRAFFGATFRKVDKEPINSVQAATVLFYLSRKVNTKWVFFVHGKKQDDDELDNYIFL